MSGQRIFIISSFLRRSRRMGDVVFVAWFFGTSLMILPLYYQYHFTLDANHTESCVIHLVRRYSVVVITRDFDDSVKFPRPRFDPW
jgi:hypothetical protein